MVDAGRTTAAIDWSLRGDRMTVVSPFGAFHSGERDPSLSLEDQARKLAAELYAKLAKAKTVLVLGKLP